MAHARRGLLTNRDITAARLSWERASRVVDTLPDDNPHRLTMRIAARAFLCANASRVAVSISGAPFEELRELCTSAGDKASLAIGMSGLVMEQTIACRSREASRLAVEHTALFEAIGDPALTVGLTFSAIALRHETGEPGEMVRLAQRMIDLAARDPAMGGDLILGSPLAVALAWRGVGRWCLGIRGWRED